MADLDKVTECLWGCAIGDSLGLPFEGLSPGRISRLWNSRELKQRFAFGKGMVSDDTDHSLIVARCLLQNPADPKAFQRAMARDFKKWILAMPPGIGLATLRSGMKLCLGVSPEKSGVFSAGNGPAMRSAVIGCLVPDDKALRREFTERSSQLSHSDPKASYGAIAIAEIAANLASGNWQERPSESELIECLRNVSVDAEWLEVVNQIEQSLRSDSPYEHFVGKKGVSGYIYQTVPFAVVCWYLNFGDFAETLRVCIRCGGDADTTAAICGSLAALSGNTESIREDWRKSIHLWPFSPKHFEDPALRSPGVFAMALRNLFSLLVIFVHCGRRSLPPY